MYNNSYEEYIRNVLGYPNNQQDIYQECNNCNMQNPYNYGQCNNCNMQGQYNNNQCNNCDWRYSYEPEENRSSELEDLYPEIYKIVYPMVKSACQRINGNVTKDDVDRMVDELYSNIEGNEFININIENLNSVQVENSNNEVSTMENRSKEMPVNRMFNGKRVVEEPKMPEQMARKNVTTQTSMQENRQENRGMPEENRGGRYCNGGLCDIIRILLLRELIGNQRRPNWGPGPGRPPFPPPPPPGRPPFPPPGRPPFYRE